MAFDLLIVKNPSRSGVDFAKATGTAFAKGAIVARDLATGKYVPATSTTVRSDIFGFTDEAVTAGDTRLNVHGFEVFENDVFTATTTNNSNAAHNTQRMKLTNSTNVNNTGTDDADGVVYQVDVIGAPADKKILVKFV